MEESENKVTKTMGDIKAEMLKNKLTLLETQIENLKLTIKSQAAEIDKWRSLVSDIHWCFNLEHNANRRKRNKMLKQRKNSPQLWMVIDAAMKAFEDSDQ